jgi:dephospho-CoA kinase
VKVVALTGGIGSGKSTVSALLRERGAAVVDADAVVREVQEPGTPVFEAMVERFGPGIVAADGTLDRQAVADVVFNDTEALAALNAIVHPAVGAEIYARIASHEGTDDVVIADIPLLVEGKSAIARSGLLVVDVPVETQVERLVTSRGFPEADARARIARQASREQRLAQADRVIDNGGSPAELAAQIDGVWAWIEGLPETVPGLAVTPPP